MQRAYAFIETKAVNEDQRIIEGLATTPAADRVGDQVDPMGAVFKLPLPLLWQHDHDEPVGQVIWAQKTAKGIKFRAQFAKTDEPGTLKDRLDEAWQSIKLKLVQAVSIGFRDLEHTVLDNGGWKFLRWEWLELSPVTVPANAQATITSIKAIDRRARRIQTKANTPEYHVGASKTLPVKDGVTWNGAAAAGRMLDDAGIGGDNPDYARARRGFLIYDGANPDLRGSYHLPFADIVDGRLTAIGNGVRNCGSRLPQMEGPSDAVRKQARTVLDGYMAKLNQNSTTASGRKSTAGVSAKSQPTKSRTMMKNITEKTSALEKELNDLRDRLSDFDEKDFDTLTEDEQEEIDAIGAEIDQKEKQLKRALVLSKNSASNAGSAREVNGSDGDGGAVSRAGQAYGKTGVKGLNDNVEPGILFARYAICMASAKGMPDYAAQLAEKHFPEDPRISSFIKLNQFTVEERKSIVSVAKAGVGGAVTTGSGWADAIAQANVVATDFVAYLRGKSIIDSFGQNGVPGLRPADFNVKYGRMTAGTSAGWNGQLTATAVSKGTLDDITMGISKVTGLAVLSKEQIRFGNVNTQAIVRDDLAAAVIEAMDTRFASATAAVSNVSPAGIINGVSGVASAGATADDVRTDLTVLNNPMAKAKIPQNEIVILVNDSLLRGMSLMKTALGIKEFPDLVMGGGRLEMFPIIGSSSVPFGDVIAVAARRIFLADDGDVSLDMSSEATIEMDSSPAQAGATPTGASGALVNMFQSGGVALKVERYVNWAKNHASGVSLVTGAAYGGAAAS